MRRAKSAPPRARSLLTSPLKRRSHDDHRLYAGRRASLPPRGGLYEPGDPEYEDTCTLFNSMIDKRPRYVAQCAAPDDVVAALAFGREQGLEIAVRAGGHSVTGASL